MNFAANPGFGYQPTAPGDPARGTPTWYGMPYWQPYGMSRPACIALMILGFAFWWPIGLAILAYGIASGRLGCRGRRGWRNQQQQQDGQGPWQSGSAPWDQWRGWCSGGGGKPPSSGNRAFDDYRTETLRRLEEEQKEFGDFLERLRFARDKQEFDQFMAERRHQPPAPPAAPEQPPA